MVEIATTMGLWEYGRVKTTLELPDDLFREAKATAAKEGTKLKDLVAQGLRLALATRLVERRQAQFPLVPAKPGAAVLTAARVAEVEAAEDQSILSSHARPRRR